MVARLSRRAQFAHLRAHATTERVGKLRISFVPWEASIGPAEPAVAFAIPRNYGTAVRRNRVRRRLREVVRAVESDAGLPPGWLLVGVMRSRVEPTSDELMDWFTTALERIEGKDPALGRQRASGHPRTSRPGDVAVTAAQ